MRAGRAFAIAAGLALAAGATAAYVGAGVERPAALGFVRVASGFSDPVFVTAPRSEPNRLYVVEKTGQVVLLVRGRRRPTPFLDLSSQVSSSSEQGLLSMAFDPDYAKNRFVYVDYTDRVGNTRIVRYTTNGTRALPQTRRQLLRVVQPFPNHNGGLVSFGPDRRLYVGMGDGGSGGDPGDRAQNLGTKLGKLLRLGPKGWQIVAYGLRNPWRYSWDRATGDLYIGDVGQGSWEEIDYVPASSTGLLNFGWSIFEGNTRFKDRPVNPAGRLVAPVYVYSHDNAECSVTGGYVYRGRAVPAAKGLYFFGDFCTGHVWTTRVTDVTASTPTLLPQTLDNVSSFGEDARGELYATTLGGTLYRLRG